jgi:DNA-binding CsgD family transcriptional regulator
MHLQDVKIIRRVPCAQASHAGSSIFTPGEWQSLARWLKLSAREVQIVQGVFDNHKENEIAGNLNISPHTVHTYLERLYHKLGVAGRVPLVVMVATVQINPASLTESVMA